MRAAFSQVGGPVMLLKGAALTDTLYEDPVPRLTGDIDLVVPMVALPACREVMLDLGYQPTEVEVRPRAHALHRSQQAFLPSDPLRAPVELHWHVLEASYYWHRLPMRWFWEHSETRTIGGQPFQVLDAVANLVYLCSLALDRHRRPHPLGVQFGNHTAGTRMRTEMAGRGTWALAPVPHHKGCYLLKVALVITASPLPPIRYSGGLCARPCFRYSRQRCLAL